jgi:hypothetical protein
MDINQSLQPVIASLIDDIKGSIEEELRSKITDEIIKRVANAEINTVINQAVADHVENQVAKYNFAEASSEQLAVVVAKLTDQINNTIAQNASAQVSNFINQRLAAVDLTFIIDNLVERKLSAIMDSRTFPHQSIPHTSIDFSGLVLRGDHIKDGIIERFGSIGIEDRASQIQMTVMDTATAFEGPIWAPELVVKGNVVITNNLSVESFDTKTAGFKQLVDDASVAVKNLLDSDLFTSYGQIVFDKIKQDGIELDIITQGGKDVVKGNQLGYHIVDTNIQRLGLVKDLQTQGEAYFSETVYVTNGRLGVNTTEPSSALSVWDQEVEINTSKLRQNTGYIGTPRHQSLVLGANGKENITLTPEGTVEVESINIGNVPMSSAAIIPNYVGITGQIVWNESPSPGGASGWICLGGARWAKLSTIE